MIIDSHVHLLPDRLADAVRAWFDTHAWDCLYREGVDACVERLKSGGIDRLVALPYVHRPGLAAALNDFTRDVAKRHPQVLPCCTVLPGEEGAERLIDEALGSGAFVGVKIHCHVMKLAADDPRLDPVFGASARYRRPVVIHAGRVPVLEGYGLDVRTVSGVESVRRALQRHPEAIVVIPHLGADEFEAFEALLGEFEHLYLDTAMALAGWLEGGPDLALIRRNPTRILYGTDFPNLPYDWTREREVIRGLALPAEDEALVMGGNAARLFGGT